LWFWDVWPAGDAKFFVVCAAFVPLLEPAQRAFPFYLSLQLLINVFVLAAVYVLAATALSAARGLPGLTPPRAAAWAGERALRALSWLVRQARAWRDSAPVAVNTAGLFLLQAVLQPFLEGRLARRFASPLVLALLLIVLWRKLGAFIADRRLAAVSSAGLLAFAGAAVFRPDLRHLLGPFVARVAGFGVLFGAFGGLLDAHMTEKARVLVGVDGILPGAILSERTLALLRRDPDYFEEHFSPLFKDGLSAPQAEALKQWLMGLPPEQAVVETLRGDPFGVWIFAGTLFTLAASRDAASALMGLFR